MRVFAAVLLACAVATTAQAKGRPFTVEDLLSLEDTGHAAFSADGRWLVYETFAPWKTAQRFDRDFSTQDARQLIAVVDKDGNGEMGFEEFKELLEEIMV